jgi:DNA-binding HxlR family transcriptional regulator
VTMTEQATETGLAFDVYAAPCPSRQALDRIADRWTTLIIGQLAERPHRFGELRRAIGGISQKMLTQTLRGLERDGLVSRRVLPTTPVAVEYALTPLGETLIAPMAAIHAWAEAHVPEMMAARRAYEDQDMH